ncbi:unnamed protein product [Pipistrellus nathusii]|uniref:Uncharacterized protein n=1 Tax=Pipistrellus nathusii TaxID=59473 RepID=A0ABN9Z258_PIPNA
MIEISLESRKPTWAHGPQSSNRTVRARPHVVFCGRATLKGPKGRMQLELQFADHCSMLSRKAALLIKESSVHLWSGRSPGPEGRGHGLVPSSTGYNSILWILPACLPGLL